VQYSQGMSFAAHYDDFYRPGDDVQRAWRATSAVEKAANIEGLWRAAKLPEKPVVVDIGTGDGAIPAELARSGFFERLDGFDVSGSGIAIADGLGIAGASFAVFDGIRLPVDEHAYDLAILSHVVEHVEEPRTLIREAARVARWLVVEVPLERNVRHRGDFEWTDTGHVNFYDTHLIRKLVQSCGLDVVAERVTNPGRVWADHVASRTLLAKWQVKQALLRAAGPLAREVFTYHAIVLARSRGDG
jgi:SAM-dependent methyltransferase